MAQTRLWGHGGILRGTEGVWRSVGGIQRGAKRHCRMQRKTLWGTEGGVEHTEAQMSVEGHKEVLITSLLFPYKIYLHQKNQWTNI